METVTCKFCKQKIDKLSAYKIGEKTYYCNAQHYNLQLDKNKYKPKKNKSNGEPNDRRILTDYIQKLYVDEGYDKHFIPWKLITSVLKNQMDENKDMTYMGIQYTLWYCKEIADINLFNDKSNSILWCVPFNYHNAQQYYNHTCEIEQSINDYDFNYNNIVIKKNKNKDKNKKYKEIKFD